MLFHDLTFLFVSLIQTNNGNKENDKEKLVCEFVKMTKKNFEVLDLK